jgi:hypothetical protein
LPFESCAFSSRPRGGSAIQPRHRADRRAGAAFDLDRKADELEPALADELVEMLRPVRPGLTASTPNMPMPFLPSQVADSLVSPGKSVMKAGVPWVRR